MKKSCMIKSMTGYGKASLENEGKKITVEIRSLNSRQFDLSLRLASVFREKELELRNLLSKHLERGKVDFSLYFEAAEEVVGPVINRELARSYFKQLQSLSQELGTGSNDLLHLVMKMPDVMKGEKPEFDEKEWEHASSTVNEAIKAFQNFRAEEGKVLQEEFTKRINLIMSFLSEIESQDSSRIKNIKQRIHKSLEEVVDKERIDENRFEQELIFYLEKIDITEEKLRLKTHCDYFIKTMEEDSPGRKLGFITQEIGREINTIGSKANNADIQKIVVQMKDELEKVKEQLLNVL